MKRNYAHWKKGQGLVEYALVLVLVAIVVIAILALLGPQIGSVFSEIVGQLGGGPIADVTAARTGGGTGNDVNVTVTLRQTVGSVTATDSQSGATITLGCSGLTCTGTLSSVGFGAGTVTARAGGYPRTTSYSAKP